MNTHGLQFKFIGSHPRQRPACTRRCQTPSRAAAQSSVLANSSPSVPALICATLRFAPLVALWVTANLVAVETPKPSVAAPLTAPVTNAARINAIPTVGAAVASTNATTAISTNKMETLDDKHKLAIGDRLSFRIIEDEEDPKQLFVTDSGDLEVPYLGRYPAESKTCKELAHALKTALEIEFYYQATVVLAVDVMAKSRGKVYLVGPVRAAGPQEIPSDEVLTLSKAILRAGGFGDFADKTHVRVTRKKSGAGGTDQTFIVNVALILEKGQTTLDLTLEPGDFIYVPERSIRF